MKRYWLAWFIITFPLGFLIPETIALIRGRVDDTLSGAGPADRTLDRIPPAVHRHPARAVRVAARTLRTRLVAMNDNDERQPTGYIEISEPLTEEQAAEIKRIWIECLTAAIPLLPVAHVYRDLPRRTKPKD